MEVRPKLPLALSAPITWRGVAFGYAGAIIGIPITVAVLLSAYFVVGTATEVIQNRTDQGQADWLGGGMMLVLINVFVLLFSPLYSLPIAVFSLPFVVLAKMLGHLTLPNSIVIGVIAVHLPS